MNTATNNHQMKTDATGKRHHMIRLLQNAGIETGAWMMSLGFFAGIIWMAASII
jgi:hypothetical protein